MSRRLAEMTEQSIAGVGSRASKKTVDEAGFSEELKRSLEEKIAQANFQSENASAFAEVDMPASVGRGTREMAASQPWTGAEEEQDAVLRMLVDAHPPLKTGARSSSPSSAPSPLNPAPRREGIPPTSRHRLVNARDRSSIYALTKDPSLSPAEKEQMRKELKERFTPAARPMPTSVQGLASLANERIEDAIARGQFKNLPRGKVIERDYNASSPFLDTTEYFMNKIIQKQDIVPPWIEKQQELAKAAAVFRGRLRSDWKRHAARTIASKGGSLHEQVKRAERYAEAEEALSPRNPTPLVEESLQVSAIRALESVENEEEALAAATAIDTLSSAPASLSLNPELASETAETLPSSETEVLTDQPPASSPPPEPFRDPDYLLAERSYHTLSITTLNALTRTYNLMAPDLAKKPYFSLDRELRSCFADVAPLLPQEIRDRARAGVKRVEEQGHRKGGVMERFAGTERVSVYDDRRRPYGFREFWRDVWGSRSSSSSSSSS